MDEQPSIAKHQHDLEYLRQIRETFDHRKKQSAQWFRLQLVMGYSAVVLLAVILVSSLYIIMNHTSMPTAVVLSASGAFFADVLAVLVGMWKVAAPRKTPSTELKPILDAGS